LDRDTANKVLGPFLRDALERDDSSGSLLGIVQQFGWDGVGFTGPVDLFSLSTALQKYRYERLQELGSGSYAVVYKARNRETDEVIALKKLRFGFDDQGLPSSTLREISSLKELKHENIVE
jgi:serine/threonine protein kinase